LVSTRSPRLSPSGETTTACSTCYRRADAAVSSFGKSTQPTWTQRWSLATIDPRWCGNCCQPTTGQSHWLLTETHRCAIAGVTGGSSSPSCGLTLIAAYSARLRCSCTRLTDLTTSDRSRAVCGYES